MARKTPHGADVSKVELSPGQPGPALETDGNVLPADLQTPGGTMACVFADTTLERMIFSVCSSPPSPPAHQLPPGKKELLLPTPTALYFPVPSTFLHLS